MHDTAATPENGAMQATPDLPPAGRPGLADHLRGAALAGGPIVGGRVVGSSDAKGAFPKLNPKSPQDVLATVYDWLGIDTHAQYLTNAGRPITVLPEGEPIRELM